MSESAEAGQKSRTSHPPASKPVSLAPLKFEEAVTALSRVVPQHRQLPHDARKERPASKGRVHKRKIG
jgi:hypothetical protein